MDKLTKNVGFGMGLEFRESSNVLSAGSEVPVRAGMIFNVSVGECASCSSMPSLLDVVNRKAHSPGARSSGRSCSSTSGSFIQHAVCTSNSSAVPPQAWQG